MSDSESKTLLVRRPCRITTDGNGRSVWIDPVESAELELVSTQMLKVMLSTRDDADRRAIERLAGSATDGVLVRNTGSGGFEIISDEELQEILDANDGLPRISKPADATVEPLRDYTNDAELSLVSTQALRKVLGDEDEENAGEAPAEAETVGFNPYVSR